MICEVYNYHFIIKAFDYSEVATCLDKISLQNIDERHFTINPEDASKPTYVELTKSFGSDGRPVTNVFVRTTRVPSALKRNLEPSLDSFLKEHVEQF